MEYLDLTKLPISVRVRRARDAVLFQLAQTRSVQDRTELATRLTGTLEQLNAPAEWTQGVFEAIEQFSDRGLEKLSTLSKALLWDVRHKPEKQPPIIKETSPQVADEERPFRILTQEDDRYKYVTELEYKKQYANVPDSHSKEPLVWINLKTNAFSLWVGRECRRRKPIITGQKQTLFCTLLRNFNECIPTKELKELLLHHPQILSQLNDSTFGVLKPFIEIRIGESRTLRPYSKYNHKRKFTFCLIEPVEE